MKYEFHLIVPRLAKTITVVAVDLRGVDQIRAIAREDIHQLAAQLQLARYRRYGRLSDHNGGIGFSPIFRASSEMMEAQS
jgi:hypothetical protein